MDAVFLRLLNMSMTAGWLILAVTFVRLLLKKAPKWISCALWGIAAVRLICPFSLESSLSLIPSGEFLSPETVQFAQEPFIDSGISYIDAAVNPAFGSSLAPAPGASVNPLQVWMLFGGILWGIGLAVMISYALASVWRMRRKVREAVPLRENIFLCDQAASPFILGIVRPRIYLPSGMEEIQRVPVLAHERAHLTRRDHWWKPLAYLLLSVYWFHPLVWAAYLLFCRDLELACDEKVIRAMDLEERKAYSRALVACSLPKRIVPACPLAFGEVGIKERVKKILYYKKPGFWITLGAAAACILVTICFLTNPKKDGFDMANNMKETNEKGTDEKGTDEEETGDIDEPGRINDIEKTDVFGESEINAAIRTAILEENQPVRQVDYDAACCDFVCLATVSDVPETEDVALRITYYGWAMYEAYRISEKGMECAAGSHLPVALTFERQEGNLQLKEYWKPRDGSYFAADVREKFPARIAEEGIDSQKYVLRQTQNCYRQAVAYSGLDTDAVIRDLLDAICSEPLASSNPQDYIDAHIGEYRELLFYGGYTLEYGKIHVLGQEEADLASVVLSLACGELSRQEEGALVQLK